MRDLANSDNIREFIRVFGRLAKTGACVYFSGGSTAVIEGWRDTTLDIDIKFEPELDELFRGISSIKERLKMNIELAAPSDFIPELPGWRDRSKFICREGNVTFYSYDPYSQALAKIERGHEKDLLDVEAMFARGMIEPSLLLKLFHEVEPQLYKYPAIDPATFARSVTAMVEKHRGA